LSDQRTRPVIGCAVEIVDFSETERQEAFALEEELVFLEELEEELTFWLELLEETFLELLLEEETFWLEEEEETFLEELEELTFWLLELELAPWPQTPTIS
jgi:hypothetical protein